MNFQNFLADMGERPDGMTIDRLNTNGHYEPGNCAWATAHEQAQNQRVKVRNGDVIPLLAAAERVVSADNDNVPASIEALRDVLQLFKERRAA